MTWSRNWLTHPRPHDPTARHNGRGMKIAYDRTAAAKQLCLKVCEFQRLVDQGALPEPRRIGPVERWFHEDLTKAGTGAVDLDEIGTMI